MPKDNVMSTKPLYAIVAAGLLLIPSLGFADPDTSLNAKLYMASLVQAMDECTSAVTNVAGVGACDTANVDTDGTHFRMGKVTMKAAFGPRQIIMNLKSSGTNPPNALGNRLVHLVIVLRVTRTNQAPLVTWVDQVLDCPDLAIPSNGNAVQKMSLTDCGLAGVLADNTTNKEVVALRVVDSTTGKAIAVPGLRRTH
jgi:hypothetical protein